MQNKRQWAEPGMFLQLTVVEMQLENNLAGDTGGR